MAYAKTWVLLLASVAASRSAAAQPSAGFAPVPAAPPNAAPPESPPAAPEGAPAQSPPAAPPPAAAEEPSPAQAEPGASPAAAAAPAQEPPTAVPPTSPSQAVEQRATSSPATPAEDPTSIGATTTVDAAVGTEDPTRTRFALEFVAGLIGASRFQSDAPGRETQDAVDGMYGLGAMIGTRSALYGLALDVAGIGRDHYGSANGSTTINASYNVGTLWLQGRWYLSETRPAVFLAAAAGPALPFVRATGTQPSGNPVVAPPVAFECSATGTVGLGLAAALGVEFDIANAWSLISDARFAGHVLSRDVSEFGTCAPAAGSALSGTVRLGVQLRL